MDFIKPKKNSKDKQPPSPNDPYDRIFESGSLFPRTSAAAAVAAASANKGKKDSKDGKSPKTSSQNNGEVSRRSWLGETGVYGNVNNVAHGAATTVNRPLREIDCFRQFCDETTMTSKDASSSSKGSSKEFRIRKAPILNRRGDKNKNNAAPNKRTPFVEKYADSTYGKPSRYGNDLLGPST